MLPSELTLFWERNEVRENEKEAVMPNNYQQRR
jgi:hypothetical protein